MNLDIPIGVTYDFAVRARYDDVYGLLSDVPASAGFFPGVEHLKRLGRGVYRWEMQRVGTPDLNFRTAYACQYVSSKAKGSVAWTPVRGEGNADVSGSWAIVRRPSSTALTLDVEALLRTPFPALLRPVAEPLLRLEFERILEQYIDNLIERFGGEV
jgi:carbon monoxide dehydrogenase subunit G